MLYELLIQHFLYIDRIKLNFQGGMTVVTGETGAGKSILLDALSFVLGGKLHRRSVQAGGHKLLIQASFDIQNHTAIHVLLEEYGLPSSAQLCLRRVMDQEGRSKAFINDVPVTIQLLKIIATPLMTMHGQHGEMLLMDQGAHRTLLDASYPDRKLQSEVAESYDHWKGLEKRYQELADRQHQSQFELEYLQHILQELDALKPEKDEELILTAKRTELIQQTKYMEIWENAEGCFRQHDGGVLPKLYHLQRMVSRTEGAGESRFSSQLDEAIIILEELAEHCTSQQQGGGSDDQLDAIEERLSALQQMARKLRCSVHQLADQWAEIAQKCRDLTTKDETLLQLASDIQLAKTAYQKAAEELLQHRKQIAAPIEKKVLAELKQLKLPHVRFTIQIEPLAEAEWHRQGMDQVAFHVAMNPGAELAPLQDVASGGELSRFLLAIRVVLHQGSEPLVMVFDEADSGIGGATADAVGKRLAMLARRGQVLLITHHPQVAAWAQHHILVKKRQDISKEQTEMMVRELTGDARVDELARMLAGAKLTEEARAAARTLMAATAEVV